MNTRRCGGTAAKGHCTKPLRKARATNFSAAPTVFSISARRLRDGV
ncbi:branched-chain amino acid ABC transporter ATP-binding protein [Burkholderia pseudomallei]|nr:branched-chain amino acid ABC transporter ATP-binding protein [Burkholderia pseudomallei]